MLQESSQPDHLGTPASIQVIQVRARIYAACWGKTYIYLNYATSRVQESSQIWSFGQIFQDWRP